MSPALPAVLEGLVWSALWIIMLMCPFYRYPWLLVHDYPPDARAAAHLLEPSPAQRRNGILFAVCCYIILIGTLLAAGLIHYAAASVSFGTMLLYLWIICVAWNVVDLLVMDWLLFCTITPKSSILPDTGGCEGYKDYRFYLVGFGKGCICMTLFALIFAVIDFVILKFLLWQVSEQTVREQFFHARMRIHKRSTERKVSDHRTVFWGELFTKMAGNGIIWIRIKERIRQKMGVIGSVDGPTSIIVSQGPLGMGMLGILAIAAVAVVIVIIALVIWALARHGRE